MNIYSVKIDDEVWDVTASGIMAAIRRAMNYENLDRKENDFFSLDREVREHSITIIVELVAEKVSDEELEEYFEVEEEAEAV